ncbi:MAG: hypothetical protein IH623_25770 [Verrucomicrobia bacterium]|nr:hypothetical protein [Verrucomicrobiota bacterium]
MNDCLVDVPGFATALEATGKVVFQTFRARVSKQHRQHANPLVKFLCISWDNRQSGWKLSAALGGFFCFSA